jgi:hypothetical protein
MLTRRLDSLPRESRAFLETLAVCGRPIVPARIFEACGFTGDERPLVACLRSAHFLRGSRSPDQVELYHDRIRETLAADVSRDSARRIHALMAEILTAHGDDDPEALFEHHRGAGHEALAAAHAGIAAARASAVLAFDRAAAFYRHALELAPTGQPRAEWTIGLAKALENAGRPAEAGDAYLDAAREGDAAHRFERLRKAAEQQLIGGHIDRGLAIIGTILPVVGMRLNRGPRSAAAAIVGRRARLAWRGVDFDARDASHISPEHLLRIDTCWAISTGLLVVDTVQAASFHTRHLIDALDAGEPYRVARALAIEACLSAAGGGRAGVRRSAAFAARARGLAERIGHPHAIALSELTAGVAAFVLGDWARATDMCGRAMTMLRDECTGVPWELTLAQNFYLGSLFFRGELVQVSRILPGLLQAARERGNLYFETELTTRFNMVWLVADDPDGGEREANRANARWSDSGYHRQHYNHMYARVQASLYRARAEQAWALATDHAAAAQRHLWLHVYLMRVETAFLRGRCALAMAAAGHDARRMRTVAARDAGRLEREQTPWATAMARQMRATIAFQEGDRTAAAGELERAVGRFVDAGMLLYASVARWRLAALVGGDRGREHRRLAGEWLAAQEVRNPAAMAALLAPGLPD